MNDDKDFLVKLFRNTILHADEFGETIKANISNWDYDRVALMDRIIMQMAMTEFCYFPTIPVKVTTSLGYINFDDNMSQWNHPFEHFDGHTAPMTIACEIAARWNWATLPPTR